MEAFCEFSSKLWLNGDSHCQLFSCTVKLISITKPGTEIKLFKGMRGESKTNEDVEGLVIENQLVEFFPINLHKVFPNLTHLAIKGCKLKQISANDLKGLENLKHIDLFDNKLTVLRDNLFNDIKNLQDISFQKNHLTSLSSKLLQPIEGCLEYADFRNNPNFDAYFLKGKKPLKLLMKAIDESFTPPRPELNHNCDDEKIERLIEKLEKVHRINLAKKSSVFKAMLPYEPAEAGQASNDVKSYSETAIESFLSFFYTGRIEHGVNLSEMFKLASDFDVPELKATCARISLKNLSESNALEVFNLGHKQAMDDMIHPAFEVITKMYPSINDNLINKPDEVNRILAAKRKYSAEIENVKKFKNN